MEIAVRNENTMTVNEIEKLAEKMGCFIEIVGKFKLKDKDNRHAIMLDMTKANRDIRNIKAIYIEKEPKINNSILMALFVKKEK